MLSQRSSKEYNCCMAISQVDFPVCTFAAFVTPSLSTIRLSTMPMVEWFLVLQSSSVDKGGSFCFLLCILCFSRKDFKYSFFHLFHPLSLHLLIYFARFLKSRFTESMSSSKLYMSSPCTKVLGVTIGNCVYRLPGDIMVYHSMCFQYPEVFLPVRSISGLLSLQTCKDTVSLIWLFAHTDLPTKGLNLN